MISLTCTGEQKPIIHTGLADYASDPVRLTPVPTQSSFVARQRFFQSADKERFYYGLGKSQPNV